MSLAWHIVRKDLRRLSAGLAFWAVLLIARGEIGVHLLHGDGVDLAHFDLLKVCSEWLIGVDAFVNAILVALLVQEDPLVGTTMNWATRPISGGRLLFAKLLAAAVMFGLLPVLIALRWWLACGYGPAEMSRALLVLLDGQALVVLVAFLIASLTDSIARFLGTALGIWLAFAGVVIAVTLLRGSRSSDIFDAFVGSRAVFGLMILPLSIATIVLQYRTRRLARSVKLLASVGVLATVLVAACDLEVPWYARGSANQDPKYAAVTVTAVRAHTAYLQAEGSTSVYVEYGFDHVPADVGVVGVALSSWQYPDGHVARRLASLPTLSPTLALWRSLGLPDGEYRDAPHRWDPGVPGLRKFRFMVQDDGLATAEFLLERKDIEPLHREAARFTGDVLLSFIVPEPVAEIPLAAGESRATHGAMFRISHANWRDEILAVAGVESQPVGHDLRPGLSTFFARPARMNDDLVHLVVDRHKGVAHSQDLAGEATVIGMQAVRWFNTTIKSRDEAAGASLAFVRYRITDSIRRQTTVERLSPAIPE